MFPAVRRAAGLSPPLAAPRYEGRDVTPETEPVAPLPILPLRNTVVYPDVFRPLVVRPDPAVGEDRGRAAPKLPARRPDLVIRPLGDRGRYVVKDPRTGAFFTFGEQEHFLLAQLDGERGAAAVCQAFAEHFGEPLSEGELGQFVELARRKGLLQAAGASAPRPEVATRPAADGAPPTLPPAPAPPAPARSRQSLLYWRKNIFDPDRLFNRLAPRLGFLWTWSFLLASGAGILLAAALAWANRHELVSSFASAWRWETALLVWLTLVVATTLHEFAHGLTCKHHGGEVHEVGFLLMFFVPCFYCNVSDAWLFRERSKRLWVTLAGGYCDLCLWALAVFIWRLAPLDGLVNYLAWVVLSVLGARVFFNFNPLLKLDGYYLLSDWLELPNLRQRSWERVAGWVRWLLWGGPRPAPAPRGRFLLAYGLASRLFSLCFLILMLVGFSRLLGAGLGWAGAGLVALLGVATVPGMFRGFAGGEVRTMIRTRRKRAVAWLLAAGGLAAVLFVRVEDRAGGPFEAAPTTRAEIRAPVAGFLHEILYDEGEEVYVGAPVARLEIPDLDSQLAQKRAAVREAAARLRMLEAGARPEELAEQRGRVKRAAAWRDLAEQDLDRVRRSLRAELIEADKQVEQHQSEQQIAERVLERYQKLRQRGASADEQCDEAEKQLKLAQAKRQQAEARRQALREKGALDAETELARRKKELADAEAVLRLLEAGSRPEEVEAERARLARLREEALYLEGLQGKLQVCTPVPGLIATPRLKERVGRYLREGDLICEVEDPGRLEVEVALPEPDAARVAPGQAVELKPRSLPLQSFPARVDRLAPRAAPAEPGTAATHPPRGELPSTVVVYCRLEATGTGLRPGLTGHARISCGERPLGEILADRALRYLRTEFWW
jgi:multidrug resistance efflux pump